jgi:asparagine synthase (glutamine-hydrolysing)
MLDPRRLDEQGFFDGRLLQARWNAHIRNGTDPKPELWPVLMFQTWLDHQATAADPQLRYA